MPTIRDTIDPTREREVSDAEATDLERQNLVLTGTRAKTPEGLRAAAVRQVLEQEAATFAAQERVVRRAPEPMDPEDPEDVDNDEDLEDDDIETPGADPASTTDDTPTRTSPQES